METTGGFSPKRQRIHDDAYPASIFDFRYANPQNENYCLSSSSRTSMPLSVDMGRWPTQLTLLEMQPAYSALGIGYDRPIQRCPPFRPALWPAAAPTPPSLPSLEPFAFRAALPGSFGIGVAGDPPPSPATDYVRLQYQLLLARLLHG